MQYIVADRIFDNKNDAINYANFIAKISRIIVAVEIYHAK